MRGYWSIGTAAAAAAAPAVAVGAALAVRGGVQLPELELLSTGISSALLEGVNSEVQPQRRRPAQSGSP